MIRDITAAIAQGKKHAEAAEEQLNDVDLELARARQALRDVGVLAERAGVEADAAAEPLIQKAAGQLRDVRATLDELRGALRAVLKA